MKILIVSAQAGLADYFRSQSEGAERTVVQYQHPLKALDNLAELAPDVVLWSHDDFPRHWKTFAAALVNEERLIRLFLVSEHELPAEEIKKRNALHIEGAAGGFHSEELAEFLRRHDSPGIRGESTIDLPNAAVYLVDDDFGAFLARKVRLRKTSLSACLVPAEYRVLPATGRRVHADLVLERHSIPLELQVQSIDTTGVLELAILNLHEAFLLYYRSLLPASA